jgi:hypothetical protein
MAFVDVCGRDWPDCLELRHALRGKDEHLSQLWSEYQQALDLLQQLETSEQAVAGQWQAACPAEYIFTEQTLVDSPLRAHFYNTFRAY